MNEFRKQLKIEAIKAAREKANYLAEAINERAGKAITITEPSDISIYYYTLGENKQLQTSNYSRRDSMVVDSPQSEIDFKRIKLRFEVAVIFELQ